MSPLTFKGALQSLRNLLIFIWVYVSLPMSLLNFMWSYQDDELSLTQVLRILIVYACVGLMMALIGWDVAFAAIIRKRSKRDRKSNNR